MLLESDDFPTEPRINHDRVYFHLPPGRKWVYLQRNSTKQRSFPRFLELPRELRDRIYFWALPLRSNHGWIVPIKYVEDHSNVRRRRALAVVYLSAVVGGIWTIRSGAMRDEDKVGERME